MQSLSPSGPLKFSRMSIVNLDTAPEATGPSEIMHLPPTRPRKLSPSGAKDEFVN